ncbi:MAG: hypothetical protein Q9227_002223 [Pyrenula ochraceoflavens]
MIEPASSSASTRIMSPPSAVHKGNPAPLPLRPTELELDQLQWGQPLHGPPENRERVPETPKTPSELEGSVSRTPQHRQVVDMVQSFSKPYMNRWRVPAGCLLSFANGLNDGAAGALIPYIESHYHIGYAITSLIFVTTAIGFILVAPITHVIDNRIGRGKFYLLGEGARSLAYIIIACEPPFPVVVASFFLVGFGIAVNLALSNVFFSNLVNATIMLGFLHGAYGIGGTVGPLIATALVSHGVQWSFFYLIPLFVTLTAGAFTGWAFWAYERDLPAPLLSSLEQTASRQAATTTTPNPSEPSKLQILIQALRNRTTLLGALFIFAYQGAEVSISGWVISFLITYRHGDPSQVGNVTAGFWGGITLGRFALTQPAKRLGEKTSVVCLTFGALAFQILVWLVPNVVGDAVAVSVVGLLLGPVYPCAMAVFSRLLPRSVQMNSLGFISAMGSSGGAAAPFFTGLLAQKLGTVVLHPIAIALFVVMVVAWGCLPKMGKRRE